MIYLQGKIFIKKKEKHSTKIAMFLFLQNTDY